MRSSTLVDAESLDKSPHRPLHKLSDHLKKQGWALRTLLVMITWVTSGWTESYPSFLGAPKTRLVWHPTAGIWSSPSASGTETPRVGCHVFANKNQAFNWLLDDVNTSSPPSTWVSLSRPQINQFAKHLQKSGVDVAEVYSPPRVTKRAHLHGLRPGFALDLTTGWDFNLAKHRSEALRLVREHRPALVLLSPPCTPFSPMRRLTDFKRDPGLVGRELHEGERRVDFSVSIALIQINAGRGFLFEHPRGAKSWKMRSLEKLQAHPQVYTVYLDMCQFELQNSRGDRFLKPTLLLTNIETLATPLSRRCDKQHKHVPLEGGQNTRMSAIYTDAFVDAILKGLRQHLRAQHFPVFDLPDSWELTPHELRCRHFCKRSALASPTECQVHEVAKLRFTGQRRTTLCYDEGDPQVWTDDWRTEPSTPPTTASWSGVTCFELQANFGLPQELQELAAAQ